MSFDKSDWAEEPSSRSWTRRDSFLLCFMLAILVILVAFAGNFLVAPVIYLAVCVEGFLIVLIILPSAHNLTGRSGLGGDGASARAYGGLDRVEMLSAAINSASKGSDISRAEIARVLGRMIDQTGIAAETGGPPTESGLSAAIETVVTDARAGGPIRETDRAKNLPTQAQYLACLDVVLSSLERVMNRTRSG